MNPVEPRKRRSAPKVRTGCGTCKVRKVKCDESKPHCQRCLTTGRKCEGYSGDIVRYSQTAKNSMELIQRVSVHIPGSTEEKRGFSFFLRHTGPELSGYYDSSFWERLLLAASAQNASLRHAVIALGTLHEEFSGKKLISSSSPGKDQTDQFALKQYAKALSALRRSLSKGKEEPLTALMCSILFVCFDSLRGCFESAMVHLQSGLTILRDMKRSCTGNDIIKDNIAPMFTRLSIQSIIYIETKSTHDKTVFAKTFMEASEKVLAPEEFGCLEDARNALGQAADALFRAFYMWDSELPLALQPTESLLMFNQAKNQLSLWDVAFQKLMACKGEAHTGREVQAAALLKIHHTTLKIMMSIRPEMSDTRALHEAVTADKYLGHVDDFRIVVNLSRPLIAAAEQDAKAGKPPLTFSSDMGLVGPLYYVCINCPSVSIQKTAMDLLLRCPRREGMWNSVLITQMIRRYWDLEASHREAQDLGLEVDEFGIPLPFTDHGAVHFAYFGQPTESTTTVSHLSSPRGLYP